jgi:8-oxo-dGTP pyrophosphatase MutT (NUDIX family)
MRDTVPVQDAATVVVVRDGEPGLEVLLLRRTSAAVFAPGAHVFPGGAVDPEDGDDLRATAAREALEESGLRLDPAALRPLARWVTPPGGPRRYDTRFYLTAAPAGQAAACDGEETVEADWWRPADALGAGITLIEPTRVTLEWLAGHVTVADALAAAPYMPNADAEAADPARGLRPRTPSPTGSLALAPPAGLRP